MMRTLVSFTSTMPAPALDNDVDAIARRDLMPELAVLSKKQVERLKSLLRESEELQQIAWTTSPYFATWLFALTDERIICLRKAYLLPFSKVRTMPLEDVTHVDTNVDLNVLTVYVRLQSGARGRFMFAPEAKNRDVILELLRSLPDQRRAKLRRPE